MSSKDPFADLIKVPEVKPSVERAQQRIRETELDVAPEEDPFADVMAPFTVGKPFVRKTIPKEFAEGVGEGLLAPVRLFIGPAEPTNVQHPTARLVGDITGELISFGVVAVATSGALSGVGLTARMTSSVEAILAGVRQPTVAKRLLTRSLHGGLSFGLFEAGGAESIGQTPEEFVKGFAIGAAFEGALVGGAIAFRGNFPKIRGVRVDPDAIRLERQLHPNGVPDPGELVTLMKDLGNPNKQLTEIGARHAMVFRPSGIGIITGVENPGRVIRFVKQANPSVTLDQRRVGNLFELLVVDSDIYTNKLIAKLRTEAPLRAKFLGEGEPALSVKDALELVKLDTEFEIGGQMVSELGVKVDVQPGTLTRLGTLATAFPGQIIIAKEAPEFLSTLTHEYTHVWLKSRGFNTGDRFLERLLNVPETLSLRAREELLEATKRVRMKKLGLTLKAAEEEVASNPVYFEGDHELLSRMAELLFLDPKLAREVAPNASRLMAQRILEDSPKLRIMLSRGETRNLHDWLEHVAGRSVFKETRVVERARFELSAARRAQWRREGVSEGMEVYVNGTPYEFIRFSGDAAFVRSTQAGRFAGAPFKFPRNEVSLPTYPQIITRTKTLLDSVKRATEGIPAWVGVTLRDPEGGFRKVLVELDEAKWIRRTPRQFEEAIDATRNLKDVDPNSTVEQLVEGIAKREGVDGILVDDNGLLTLHVGRQEALKTSESIVVVEPPVVDGVFGSRVINVSTRSKFESMLMEAGASEVEVEALVGLAERELSSELALVVDSDVKAVFERLSRAVDDIADDLGTQAERANLEVVVEPTGDVRVRNRENLEELATFKTEDEAREFLARSGTGRAFDLTGNSPLGSSIAPGGGGGGPPLKLQEVVSAASPPPQERPTFFQTVIDAINLLAPWFTSMESLTNTMERVGLGPAASRIFRPSQRAYEEYMRQIGAVVRPELDGKSIRGFFDKLQLIASKVDPKRFNVISGWIETMSREEIERAGGLLRRGMTEAEKTAALDLEKLGFRYDVPRLLATERLAQNLIKNRAKFIERVRRLQRQELTPEVQETIQRLSQIPVDDVPETVDELMKIAGFTDKERLAAAILRRGNKMKKDEFSSYAVSRWLEANTLPKGFKDSRQHFATVNRLTSRERELAKELDRLLTLTFRESGLDARRELGGYWPHLRRWSKAGLPFDSEFRRFVPPESIEWSALRFRTGELNVYDTDPILVAYKHVRNLFMKRHFDPILPDVKAAIKEVRARDPRAARILNEYVNEIMGRPATSFMRANRAVESFAKAFGVEAPERIAERIVNTLTGLGYSATIPFRPALTMRNWFQMVQMVLPRIGARDFWNGVSQAMTDEGFELALRAGAVPAETVPLHAASEVLQQAFRTLRPAHLQMKRVFDAGFRWYKSADDFGRAVAYHSIRNRVKRVLPDYMGGRISWDEFLNRAKIRTFDSNDIDEFTRLFKAGQIESATDHLGRAFAREAHFRYGAANHPSGWNSVYGRLFGQFGVWPVQYKDLLLQMASRGTTKDKIEFFMLHAAVNGGVLTAGAAVGLNLWSWVTFPSLFYSGGPYADVAVDLIRAVDGSPTEQRLARRSLAYLFPSLEDPRSIFIPGSYMVGDISRALGDPSLSGAEFLLESGGFRTLQPGDDVPIVDWILE